MLLLVSAWNALFENLRDGDEFSGSSTRNLPFWLVTLLLAASHLATASFDHFLFSGGGRAILVIPETGLDLVAVMLFGRRCWPILFAAYFATVLWLHVAWAPSLGVAAASVLQCFVAGWVFRQIAGLRKILGEFVDLVGIVAATLTPAISTGLGTLCLVFGSRLRLPAWEAILTRWWIAEALGILTLAPVLLILARCSIASSMPLRGRSLIRFASYFIFLSGVCYYIFFRAGAAGLLFAVFAFILIATAWLGPLAARLSALIVAIAAILATHTGLGAFVGQSLDANRQNLDLFLVAVSITGLSLGAFRATGNLGLPGSVLLAGWALSGWLYVSLDRDRVNYDEARFDKVITSVETRIHSRFTTYEDALRGAAGLVAVSGQISPKEWHIYINRSGLLEHYPGTALVSVVQPVPDRDLDTFVKAHRKGEWPDFTVKPITWLGGVPEAAGEHLLLMCTEPAAAFRAIGGDLAGDPVRRAAAEQSRDSGIGVLTHSTILGGASGKGLLLFVPVYREGAPLTSVAERRTALIAWVTVVFQAEPFFRSALAELLPMIGLRVYDGERPVPNARFFSSGADRGGALRAERTTHLTLGGNTWTLTWSRSAGFPFLSRAPSAWVAGCTALLSLLSAILVMTLQSTKKRASGIAATQTAELKASEARKTAIMDSALDPIITIDVTGSVTEFNPAAEKTFGYSRDQVIGRELAEIIIPPELREAHRRGLARTLTTGKGEILGKRIELAALRADGTEFPVELAVNRVNHEGLPIYTAYLRDLSERKLAEQRIAQLAEIVDSADAGIISKDLNDKVLTWNRGAERIYGYSAEEAIGGSMASVIPPDRLEEDAALKGRVLRGESVSHLETTRITKSGQLIHVLLTISPIRDRKGNVVGVALVAWDISQVKQLEQQLAQAQKLESIGQLAAGVAHEINTPIQYIGDNARFLEDAFRDLVCFVDGCKETTVTPITAGFSGPVIPPQEIEDGVLDYLRDEVPKSIGQLIEGVGQVANIVRAMKEFSHPGPVEKMPVDINRSIESTIVVSRNEWKYVADVTTDLWPELPPVPCVAGELNQVILNLIVNAAHAIADVVKDSGRKGTIHISTHRMDSALEIRISDTGGGIPKAIQAKVFDPFFTTKPVGKGTGQGLAIAHSVIVQKHRGVLTFESEAGKGTTFIIQLPLVAELEPA